jgi:hypothetical protein
MAHAQSGPTALIRDTEIENYLKEWANPVIKAAELDPDAVNIILVQDSRVNAFVAGGQNIFLYTGLLTKSKNPGEVIGVIAHELGHIRGGHLIRSKDAMENASYEAMLGTILGIGAAILSGDGGAAAAISAGSNSTGAEPPAGLQPGAGIERRSGRHRFSVAGTPEPRRAGDVHGASGRRGTSARQPAVGICPHPPANPATASKV